MSYDSLESRDEAFYGASLEELKRGNRDRGTVPDLRRVI